MVGMIIGAPSGEQAPLEPLHPLSGLVMEHPEALAQQTGFTPTDPFAEDPRSHYAFEVTSPVNVIQLLEEIAINASEQVADLQVMTQQADLDTPVSVTNPLYLYIASKNALDASQVAQALGAHIPATPAPVSPLQAHLATADEETAAHIESLRNGEALTAKQISAVLKHIVGG